MITITIPDWLLLVFLAYLATTIPLNIISIVLKNKILKLKRKLHK